MVRKALLSDTELSAERRVSRVELRRVPTGSTRDGGRKLGMMHPVSHVVTVKIGGGREAEPGEGGCCIGRRSGLGLRTLLSGWGWLLVSGSLVLGDHRI